MRNGDVFAAAAFVAMLRPIPSRKCAAAFPFTKFAHAVWGLSCRSRRVPCSKTSASADNFGAQTANSSRTISPESTSSSSRTATEPSAKSAAALNELVSISCDTVEKNFAVASLASCQPGSSVADSSGRARLTATHREVRSWSATA